MKKNILIVILIIIIIILSIKIVMPTITSKQIENFAMEEKSDKEAEITQETNTKKSEKQEISSSNDYGFEKFQQEQTITPPKIEVQHSQFPSEPRPKLEPEYSKDYFNPNINKRANNEIFEQTSEIQKPAKSNFEQNFAMCKPYREKLSAEYLGMLIDYELIIRGWINDKCVIDFVSRVKGTGPSFSKTYNTAPKDAQIFSFAPQIKCEFTKEQLEYTGDVVLQEKERDSGITNNMLKNPNSINLPQMNNLSQSDTRLLEVIIGDRACEIINDKNLEEMVKNLFN